jgi:hypothetical protein
MSRVGLVFCALYALIIAACVCWAFTVGDPKGHFVILQLPIALQGTLLVSLGLLPILVHLSWFAAYLFIGLPTFMLLYLLGWLIDLLRTRP